MQHLEVSVAVQHIYIYIYIYIYVIRQLKVNVCSFNLIDDIMCEESAKMRGNYEVLIQ